MLTKYLSSWKYPGAARYIFFSVPDAKILAKSRRGRDFSIGYDLHFNFYTTDPWDHGTPGGNYIDPI